MIAESISVVSHMIGSVLSRLVAAAGPLVVLIGALGCFLAVTISLGSCWLWWTTQDSCFKGSNLGS